MISIPVCGSATMEISGVWRKLPGKFFWNDGLAKTVLGPPPAPPLKPKPRGGTTGGFGLGFAIRAKLRPQPVWNLTVWSAPKNVLVPPTAVANGELAANPGDLASMPKSALSNARLSPASPVETCSEMPRAAAVSARLFSTTRIDGARSTNTISGSPKLLETTFPARLSIAKRFAISRFVNELSAASTRSILAAGAMLCADSTSSVVSNCQLPAMQPLVAVHVAVPLGLTIWKLPPDPVLSSGSLLSRENVLASPKIVFDPNAS